MWLNCRILLGNVDRSAESDTVMWTVLQNLTQLQEQSAESDTVMWEICRKWQTALQILTRHSYKSNQQNLIQLFGKSAENDKQHCRVWHSYESNLKNLTQLCVWHSYVGILLNLTQYFWHHCRVWHSYLRNLLNLTDSTAEFDTVMWAMCGIWHSTLYKKPIKFRWGQRRRRTKRPGS